MIVCREELAQRIDKAVFPFTQGGPLMHAVAAKAVALRIAASEPFRERQQRTVAGAQRVAEQLLAAGVNVLTGGTDVHLVLADLRDSELDGKQAEDRLHEIGITVNRNAVPFDPRPPAVSSGLRIGTPALATRGLHLRCVATSAATERAARDLGLVLSTLDELGYKGYVALEYRPRGSTEESLAWLPPDRTGHIAAEDLRL
jgi:glycine/serine hydroxymethyltransferase